MSIGDGFVHSWGGNGEFCVTVSPVTWTVGILAQLVKDAGRYGAGHPWHPADVDRMLA